MSPRENQQSAGRDDPAEERFRSLYDSHREDVLGYAVRRLDTPADAADIVAETFLVAWRRLPDVPDGEERAWLFGVARHHLSNHRRGRLRRLRLAERLQEELSHVSPDVAESSVEIRRILAQLPEGDREVLQLTAWEGLSPAEVATVMDIPAGTVRTRLHRARKRLRALLDDAKEGGAA